MIAQHNMSEYWWCPSSLFKFWMKFKLLVDQSYHHSSRKAASAIVGVPLSPFTAPLAFCFSNSPTNLPQLSTMLCHTLFTSCLWIVCAQLMGVLQTICAPIDAILQGQYDWKYSSYCNSYKFCAAGEKMTNCWIKFENCLHSDSAWNDG